MMHSELIELDLFVKNSVMVRSENNKKRLGQIYTGMMGIVTGKERNGY